MADSQTFSAQESRLLWIDCEMTGLDVFHDELCEIAVVPTDFDLNVLDEGIDIVIKPSAEALEQMNDFVRNMHTENGLIEKMKHGVSYQEAEKQVIDYIQPFLPKEGKAHLAGNTIGSDKKFLDHFMPNLMSQLHYRSIDVSSFKELCRRWYPAAFVQRPGKYGQDRSLGDIIESIDELRFYREVMFKPVPGPDSQEAKKICEHVEATSLLRQYEGHGRVLADKSGELKLDY